MTAVPPEGPRLAWVKATASAAAGACVELAAAGEMIALRDSKHPSISPFMYTKAEICAFLDGAKKGEFDHLVESPED